MEELKAPENLENVSFESMGKKREDERKEGYRKFAQTLAKSHEPYYPNISYNIHWFYSNPKPQAIVSENSREARMKK